MTTVLSASKKQESSPIILSEKALTIVRTIARFRFMGAVDVAYSLSTPKALANIRRILSALAGGEDYVERAILYRFPVATRTTGTKPRVYAVGAKGWNILAQEGYYRPYKLRSLSSGHLWHALLLTRIVCAAQYWCRCQSAYDLAQGMLSYELARTPPTVTLEAEGHTAAMRVVPDAWLCFERGEGEKFPILVEVDRGTEYQERFKQHVRARIAFIRSGTYARVFDTPAVVVAYVTTGQLPKQRDTRCTTMQRWTHELLANLDLVDWAPLFRFAAVEYDTLYTTPLFTAPMWYCADDPTPVPLLTP